MQLVRRYPFLLALLTLSVLFVMLTHIRTSLSHNVVYAAAEDEAYNAQWQATQVVQVPGGVNGGYVNSTLPSITLGVGQWTVKGTYSPVNGTTPPTQYFKELWNTENDGDAARSDGTFVGAISPLDSLSFANNGDGDNLDAFWAWGEYPFMYDLGGRTQQLVAASVNSITPETLPNNSVMTFGSGVGAGSIGNQSAQTGFCLSRYFLTGGNTPAPLAGQYNCAAELSNWGYIAGYQVSAPGGGSPVDATNSQLGYGTLFPLQWTVTGTICASSSDPQCK